MNTAKDYDNRNLEAEVQMLEDRVAALARRIVELMGENQMLQRNLTALEILYNEMVLQTRGIEIP